MNLDSTSRHSSSNCIFLDAATAKLMSPKTHTSRTTTTHNICLYLAAWHESLVVESMQTSRHILTRCVSTRNFPAAATAYRVASSGNATSRIESCSVAVHSQDCGASIARITAIFQGKWSRGSGPRRRDSCLTGYLLLVYHLQFAILFRRPGI